MIKNEQGYTLSELLVVIILTSLFTIIIMVFTFDLWRNGSSQQASLDTLVSRLNANDSIREALGPAVGMITQDSIADSHALVKDPAITSGDYWLPIHAIPGNTAMGASSTYKPLIYFSRYSADSTGNYIMNGAQPYQDEYVFYLDGTNKSLMQRSLANPAASGNRLKTTCPPALANGSCPSDKTIASDISSIDMRYFSRVGNLIDYTSIYDPINGAYAGPDFPVVEVVEIKLNLSKKPNFSSTNTTQSSTIIRVALRNS